MWPAVRLGDVTTKIRSGATPRGGASGYTNSRIALIRSQNVLDNSMTHEGLAHISDEAAMKLANASVEKDDVLLNITGDSVARCCVMEEAFLPARVNQHVSIIRTESQLDPRFLQRALVNPEMKNHLLTISSGGTRNALTKSMLENLEVPLPPLPEQQAIAEVLGALDDKIAANRALVATADALARAFTNECLADSTTTQLCDLATITMGSSPKGTSYNESGEGVVLYQGMKDFGIRSPLPRVWTTEPGRLAHAGDILMSVRAPVGTLNRATEECCIGRGLASLTAHQPNALFHLLLEQQTLFAPFNGDGTIFGSINKRQLHALPVRIPSVGLTELEAKTAPLEAQVASALSESATLAALRDTLLPALMDGTLRVKDAEKTVSEAL